MVISDVLTRALLTLFKIILFYRREVETVQFLIVDRNHKLRIHMMATLFLVIFADSFQSDRASLRAPIYFLSHPIPEGHLQMRFIEAK